MCCFLRIWTSQVCIHSEINPQIDQIDVYLVILDSLHKLQSLTIKAFIHPIIDNCYLIIEIESNRCHVKSMIIIYEGLKFRGFAMREWWKQMKHTDAELW